MLRDLPGVRIYRPFGACSDQLIAPGLTGLLPNARIAAPLLSRGGVAARQRKSCEATLARADGVVLIRIMIFLTSTTPAAATASAFPSSAEEGSCDSRVGQQPRQPWARLLPPLCGSGQHPR